MQTLCQTLQERKPFWPLPPQIPNLKNRQSAFRAAHRYVFHLYGWIPLSLILLLLFPTGQARAADENDRLFLRHITLNDTCQFTQSTLDSLFRTDQLLRLPAVRELEIEIGHPSDSLLELVEYRLTGLEEEWNAIHANYIRYTNLPGGDFELRLRIPGAAGKYQRFAFRTEAHQEQTIQDKWWFQPLLTFCLLLIPFTIAYFLALDRSRRNLRLEVVRNQIASDLHDDVGANLGAINNLSDLLKKRHDTQDAATRSQLIEKIKTYTRETITNLQDTVWAINPVNDSIEELLGKMKEFALLMLNAKDIAVRYEDLYQAEYPIKLDMQQRHGMFMMFKEVINNIVKHSQASAVEVHIKNNRAQLCIEVQDNGIGFDPEVLHRGNGLKNFRNRARENFIDLDLDSQPGQGARIRMMVHSL